MCVFVLLFVFVCLTVCLSSSPSYSQFQGEASKQMFYQSGFARLSLYLNVLFLCYLVYSTYLVKICFLFMGAFCQFFIQKWGVWSPCSSFVWLWYSATYSYQKMHSVQTRLPWKLFSIRMVKWSATLFIMKRAAKTKHITGEHYHLIP